MQVRSFFDQAHGELEQMLQDTSRLLGDLTTYAGVVVGPARHGGHRCAPCRSSGITPTTALVVVVLSNGAVEKHTLELAERGRRGAHRRRHRPPGRPPHRVGRAAGSAAAPATGDAVTDALCAQAVASLAQRAPATSPTRSSSAARSQVARAFDAIETVREVLGVLEQQYVVVTLLRDVLDRGLQVAIGTETGHGARSPSARSIVAPYQAEGEPAGTIGVLGPSRMDYPQAMAAVAVVSHRLSQRLTEG